MGLHDRDYGREYGDETAWDRHQRSQGQKPKSIAIILLVITCVVWLLDILFPNTVEAIAPSGNAVAIKLSYFSEWFGVRPDTLIKPWLWFECLTYGFVHDHNGINHLLFNMIGLFFFGRAVEQRLGFWEFLRFYLLAIVVGGIVGAITGYYGGAGVIGASGAVIATVILFACYYPNSQILLMFVIPVKAWVVAVFFVIYDLAGALGLVGGMMASNTAFTVHLAGAAFGLLYFFRRWHLGWMNVDGIANLRGTMRQRSRRMKLKLHDPDRKMQQDAAEADRILGKIHESGESSLTAAERKTLERYSRQQRQKREES